MTSSNGNIFRVTGHCAGKSPVNGEFPAQRPVARNFDVFFHLLLNKRLSKQSRGWWFETPSRPLWPHCNDRGDFYPSQAQLRFSTIKCAFSFIENIHFMLVCLFSFHFANHVWICINSWSYSGLMCPWWLRDSSALISCELTTKFSLVGSKQIKPLTESKWRRMPRVFATGAMRIKSRLTHQLH